MCCKNKCGCIIPIIISLVIAVIVGILFTIFPLASLILLSFLIIGIAGFLLVFLIGILLFTKGIEGKCVCNNGICLLVGILGAIIASAILLIIAIVPIVTNIIFGIAIFFITLAIIEFFVILVCLIKAKCIYKD